MREGFRFAGSLVSVSFHVQSLIVLFYPLSWLSYSLGSEVRSLTKLTSLRLSPGYPFPSLVTSFRDCPVFLLCTEPWRPLSIKRVMNQFSMSLRRMAECVHRYQSVRSFLLYWWLKGLFKYRLGCPQILVTGGNESQNLFGSHSSRSIYSTGLSQLRSSPRSEEQGLLVCFCFCFVSGVTKSPILSLPFFVSQQMPTDQTCAGLCQQLLSALA